MATTPALLNKALRVHVAPILRTTGFQYVDARNAWHWRTEDCICVLNIRAVGNHFSDVTGWPPGSVGVWLGVFFTFAPHPTGVRVDDQGRLRPAEHICHMRSELVTGVDQSSRTRHLFNPAERERKDIWWVERDGSNAEEVARDISRSVLSQGLPWYEQVLVLERALDLVEEERDCFTKFVKVALLAKRLGDSERWRKFDALAEAEARRIGIALDRGHWYGI